MTTTIPRRLCGVLGLGVLLAAGVQVFAPVADAQVFQRAGMMRVVGPQPAGGAAVPIGGKAGLHIPPGKTVSFTYTLSKKSQRLHVPSLLSTNQEGNPIGGSTRTQMEPRLRYVLSSRVTAALYYRLSQITPDAQGSSIVGTTTNEAGLDIHISI